MAFKIEQGLFNSEFTDYHAILGIPINAEIKDIRKRYLKIARRLHPDSSDLKSESDRQQANELLSKLVNPAYEYLSQEKNHSEHCILLKLKGEQAQRQQETVVLVSDIARKLVTSSSLDQFYQVYVSDLAQKQYQSLDKTLTLTAEISELNLVYLMRKALMGGAEFPKPSAPPEATSSSVATAQTATSKSPKPAATRDELLESFMRRAEELEKKQDYAKAILELREALRIKADNANCHSRLGMIYLKTKQPTMAKIHFNKAIELNPKDEIAITGLRSLGVLPNSSAKKEAGSPKTTKPNEKSGGGLFGIFGNKKK